MSSTVPAHKRTTLGAAVLKAADNRISVPHNTVSAAAQSTFTEVPGNETAARGQISSFFDQVRATYSRNCSSKTIDGIGILKTKF
jgi:hypothetical protein